MGYAKATGFISMRTETCMKEVGWEGSDRAKAHLHRR